MRLLIVEDDLRLNQSLVTQFNSAGYSVDSAVDGREGLYLAEEYAIDLAVIDLGLPELSGLELIRSIRSAG